MRAAGFPAQRLSCAEGGFFERILQMFLIRERGQSERQKRNEKGCWKREQGDAASAERRNFPLGIHLDEWPAGGGEADQSRFVSDLPGADEDGALSFADGGAPDRINGTAGPLLGGAAAAIGVYLILRREDGEKKAPERPGRKQKRPERKRLSRINSDRDSLLTAEGIFSPQTAVWTNSGLRCRAGEPRWSFPCSQDALPAQGPQTLPRRRKYRPGCLRSCRCVCRWQRHPHC